MTHARHPTQPRGLVLRGGHLHGRTGAQVAAVGQRLVCAAGDWTVDDVYLVTTETSWADGRERFVCVPAFDTTP